MVSNIQESLRSTAIMRGTNERGVVYSMAYGSKGTRFEIIRQNMGVGDGDGICGW